MSESKRELPEDEEQSIPVEMTATTSQDEKEVSRDTISDDGGDGWQQNPREECNEEGSGLTLKWFALLMVFQILFPILALGIASIFGGLLALAEKTSFLTGFLYVASNLLNMSNPLTDFNPTDAAGIVIDMYVSVVALLLFGIVLNIVNIFQVPVAINRTIERCIRGAFVVPFVAIVVVIPLSLAAIAGVFGSILAALEGWSVKDGVYYVLGNLIGLGTPLTEVLPTTVVGDVLDIIISSLALGTLAVFVDYVTALNPARYIRKRTKDYLRQHGIANLDPASGPSSLFFSEEKN